MGATSDRLAFYDNLHWSMDIDMAAHSQCPTCDSPTTFRCICTYTYMLDQCATVAEVPRCFPVRYPGNLERIQIHDDVYYDTNVRTDYMVAIKQR